MLMLRRKRAVVSRVGRRLLIGLAAGVMVLTFVSVSASTVVRTTPGGYSVSCSITAKLRFSPPLTMSGGGTRPTGLTTQLLQCTTYGGMGLEQVSHGWFRGHFTDSPFSCTTDAQTNAPITGGARWADGYDGGKRAKFENSPIQDNKIEQGSFVGMARIALDFPPTLLSQCASGGGVKSASVTGTFTLGPACGPGSGAVAVFQIAPGLMCGGVYNPTIISAGSDGALWFTSPDTRTIGRTSTSGTTSLYNLPDGEGAGGITAGPDGAMWFTGGGAASPGPSIGRITTSGTVTVYPDPLNAGPITAGPDGALWFTGGNPNDPSIGRMTTSGTVTIFTGPLITGPTGITAGPDGALWFANTVTNSIGRITTSGTVTAFTSPLITHPLDITAGPDGALWFTNDTSIGRITTSGTVTTFTDPSISNPVSITAGPGGDIWFSNYAGSPAIGSMTTSGVVTATYSDPSIVIPFDITAGPDGNLWFTGYGNDTIGRIVP